MIGPPVPGKPGITPQQTGLRPQKRLFIVLCVAIGLWTCALITMYFTTVWPERHGAAPVQRENDVDDHRPTTMQG